MSVSLKHKLTVYNCHGPNARTQNVQILDQASHTVCEQILQQLHTDMVHPITSQGRPVTATHKQYYDIFEKLLNW
jgi:hypothetical protein